MSKVVVNHYFRKDGTPVKGHVQNRNTLKLDGIDDNQLKRVLAALGDDDASFNIQELRSEPFPETEILDFMLAGEYFYFDTVVEVDDGFRKVMRDDEASYLSHMVTGPLIDADDGTVEFEWVDTDKIRVKGEVSPWAFNQIMPETLWAVMQSDDDFDGYDRQGVFDNLEAAEAKAAEVDGVVEDVANILD